MPTDLYRAKPRQPKDALFIICLIAFYAVVTLVTFVVVQPAALGSDIQSVAGP